MVAHAAAAALVLKLVFPRADAARRRALVGWWAAKLLRIVGVATQLEGDPPSASAAGAMCGSANRLSREAPKLTTSSR